MASCVIWHKTDTVTIQRCRVSVLIKPGIYTLQLQTDYNTKHHRLMNSFQTAASSLCETGLIRMTYLHAFK